MFADHEEWGGKLRPGEQFVITMIKWIRTSRLSIKTSLSLQITKSGGANYDLGSNSKGYESKVVSRVASVFCTGGGVVVSAFCTGRVSGVPRSRPGSNSI